MITKKIGVIGFGNMSGAILRGALKNGVLEKENVLVYDIRSDIHKLASEIGVKVAASNEDLCNRSSMVLLAVKPQQVEQVLKDCGKSLDEKVVLSIVAGITSERLAGMIDGETRVLRSMPNTPAMVFEGAFGVCNDSDATDNEKKVCEELFSSIGKVEWVPEKMIDIVCGLSGGGPAYVAMFIEAMADGAVRMGMPRKTAYNLAAQTCLGTAKMILEEDIHPGVLKDMVTSPGGTTIEGIQSLEDGGFRGIVMDCISTATNKSKML